MMGDTSFLVYSAFIENVDNTRSLENIIEKPNQRRWRNFDMQVMVSSNHNIFVGLLQFYCLVRNRYNVKQ